MPTGQISYTDRTGATRRIDGLLYLENDYRTIRLLPEEERPRGFNAEDLRQADEVVKETELLNNPQRAQEPLLGPGDAEFDDADMRRAMEMSLESQTTGAPRTEAPQVPAAVQYYKLQERDLIDFKRKQLTNGPPPDVYTETDMITLEPIEPNEPMIEIKCGSGRDENKTYMTRASFDNYTRTRSRTDYWGVPLETGVKHPLFQWPLAGGIIEDGTIKPPCEVRQFLQPPRPTGGRKTNRKTKRKPKRRKTRRR